MSSEVHGRKGDKGRERGDLRIRRKKEQGRGAGRYYEQCANRVSPSPLSFPPPLPLLSPSPSPSPSFPRDAPVALPSPSYSCLLFNGARRCSLIDGTGHSRAARKKERGKRSRKRKEGRREAESESDGERKPGRDPNCRAAPRRADHHRLIYNAGGVTEFTIKIPRSAALMDRRVPRNAGDDSGIFK